MDRLKVVIVDDEIDFREAVVKRLQKRNIEAESAVSGEDAINKIRERFYDVVILDVKMPGGMDGIQALREIKKISPLTEVILLTGHGSLETSIEGMKLGAFDYLLKPVKLQELLVKIGEAVEKKSVHEHKIRKT